MASALLVLWFVPSLLALGPRGTGDRYEPPTQLIMVASVRADPEVAPIASCTQDLNFAESMADSSLPSFPGEEPGERELLLWLEPARSTLLRGETGAVYRGELPVSSAGLIDEAAVSPATGRHPQAQPLRRRSQRNESGQARCH